MLVPPNQKFRQWSCHTAVGIYDRKAVLDSKICECPFASEIRISGCGEDSRISDAGHSSQDAPHFLEPAQMLIGALETITHGVHGKMRRAEFLPGCAEIGPLVLIFAMTVDTA